MATAFVIQGHYGYGWEDVNEEVTLRDGKRSLREYNENEPYAHRMIRRYVKGKQADYEAGR
jgi:hypothetical protein